MKPEPLWVVLTGGPCAGKTSVLAAIQRHFDGHVSIAPEAASEVFATHAIPTPHWTLDQWYELQYAITRQQLHNEYRARYQALKCGYPLVVCDRAPYDNAAYPAGEAVVKTMALAGQVRPMTAYDLVIHLQSLAVAAPSRYENLSNGARYEANDEARALESRALQAWNTHPNRLVISNTGSLEQTTAQVIASLQATLSSRLTAV